MYLLLKKPLLDTEVLEQLLSSVQSSLISKKGLDHPLIREGGRESDCASAPENPVRSG